MPELSAPAKSKKIHLNSKFCNNLKKARKSKRWSQGQLGRITGLSKSTIGAYEEGRAQPPLYNLQKIVDCLKVTELHSFLFGEITTTAKTGLDQIIIDRYNRATELEKELIEHILKIK